ncbi:hypothetical protein T4D_6146 [Trichinella pseudospiralis]|uniref:Uncharacterized protein n=1 Tax=Trichinella pseudospiralis TaxID=6337 RepID=A0A0V1FPP3_TRIPS|nr:hypothetical protein T4D_6146 [Trichinella pseudospiralis]
MPNGKANAEKSNNTVQNGSGTYKNEQSHICNAMQKGKSNFLTKYNNSQPSRGKEAKSEQRDTFVHLCQWLEAEMAIVVRAICFLNTRTNANQ